MRGQHAGLPRADEDVRIIPARAGPTCKSVLVAVFVKDHPRSCGANNAVSLVSYESNGSSPLVRGQPINRTMLCSNARIIPARAGPTLRKACFRGGLTDHPRSCGANATPDRVSATARGSSPLVRGQLSGPNRGLQFLRIIPARAGPTTLPKTLRLRKADHPRSCGANSMRRPQPACTCGSSPLVRGQR